MRTSRMAALAIALGAMGAAVPAEAARFGPPTGQHAAAIGSIYRAQQRNNAVIRHVQDSIRSEQSRRF